MPVALELPTDAQVFLGRLTHLDRSAVVRLRPLATGRTALWARLPWRTLVTREVLLSVPADVTVAAAPLLAGAGPEPRDHDWRWPLPPARTAVTEEIPAGRIRRVANAAASTLKQVTQTGVAGRPVGVRMVREALLDHIAITVESEGVRLDVPQRLIQAVVRMGFLGPDESPVHVLRADRWVGLAARFGTAWLPPPAGPLTLLPRR
ncbi:MAG TPA: hypothetical protein VIL37_03850 [Natronosporangium sp.]